MTNKIDETVEIPNVNYPDSGTRREDGWYMASYRYDDETVESPAKVKGNDIQFFGDSFWRGARSDRVTLLYRIAPPASLPPASLAAKDEEIARLKIALADAIRRPMGVIPDSAAGLISIGEMDEAEKRRTAETSSLAAMREAMEKARKAMAALVRWDDVTSDESCDISEEGEQEGLVAVCFQIRDALDALNQLDSTTPPAPNDDGLAKLLREIEFVNLYSDGGITLQACPKCGQENHSPDCSLARWIAKVEGR